MPAQVVTYRHRSVSKPMFVVFVVLLLIPTLIAAVAAIHAGFRGGLANLDAYRAAKTLLFFVPVVWLVLKPAGRIVVDGSAQRLLL